VHAQTCVCKRERKRGTIIHTFAQFCIINNICLYVVQQEIQQLNHMLENSASDEANLEAKIDKRKADLERNQKRLKRLEHIKLL